MWIGPGDKNLGVISVQLTFETMGFSDTKEGITEASKLSINDSCYGQIQIDFLKQTLTLFDDFPGMVCPAVLVKHRHLTSKSCRFSESNKSKHVV